MTHQPSPLTAIIGHAHSACMCMLRQTPFFILALLLPLTAWSADKANTLVTDPVRATCEKIGNKLGSVSVAGCLKANLQTTGAWSVQGDPILIKEYPPLKSRSPKARILLVGGIHGDEYSSVSIVFRWMRTLDQYHSGLFHWHVVPLLNPDGLLQRKSVRLNANGIDLNRNFPTPDWYAQTRDYWERRTHKDPRRYPGEAALSEPESHWLYEEIRKLPTVDKSLALLYLDEFSYQEIADILGISTNNVGVKLNRLRKHLDEAFARRDK